MPLKCETCGDNIVYLYRISRDNDMNFCSQGCMNDYKAYTNECAEVKQTEKTKPTDYASKMNLEETHLYYMLLHDMIDISISESGVAKMKYFPHSNPSVALAYNVPQTVEEEII